MANIDSPLADAKFIASTQKGSNDLLPLLLTGGLSSITIGITKVFLPLHALTLQANEFQLGLVSAAMSLGMLLMSFPAGKLISMINVKYAFSSGLVLSIFVYLSIYLIDNIWLFILAIVFLSATFPFRFISLQKKFLSILKKLGSTAAGWLRATQMLGTFVLGPSLAGFYLGYGTLSDFPWLIIGFLSICIVLSLTTQGLHMPAHSMQAAPFNNNNDSNGNQDQARLRSAYAIEMAIAASMNIFYGFCVLLAVSHYGLAPSEGAALIVWQGIGFATFLLFGGALLAKIDAQKTLWWCLCISATTLILLTFTWLLWHAKVLSLIMGISMAALTIINMGTFSDLSKDDESARKIATLSVFMVPLGAVIGTVIAGLLAHFSNVNFVYYLAALFISIAAAYMAFAQKRIRLKELTNV